MTKSDSFPILVIVSISGKSAVSRYVFVSRWKMEDGRKLPFENLYDATKSWKMTKINLLVRKSKTWVTSIEVYYQLKGQKNVEIVFLAIYP